jgi:cytochrome c556
MRRSALRTTVVLGGLAAVIAVGCATAQTAKMTPAETVAERQKLMKANGKAWKGVQENTKAGNVAAVAAEADTLAQNAKKIPALFPPGSLEGKTAAKPEIWQKWAEFEASAKNMEMEATKLRDTARTNNKMATEALVKDFGRKACGSCHTPFRVPPPPAGKKG